MAAHGRAIERKIRLWILLQERTRLEQRRATNAPSRPAKAQSRSDLRLGVQTTAVALTPAQGDRIPKGSF
jgi:hypothetical protein